MVDSCSLSVGCNFFSYIQNMLLFSSFGPLRFFSLSFPPFFFPLRKKTPLSPKVSPLQGLRDVYSLWLWNSKWAVSWFCFNTSLFPPFPWPCGGNAAGTICSLTQQDEKVGSGAVSPCHQLWVPLDVSELEQITCARRPPVSSKS